MSVEDLGGAAATATAAAADAPPARIRVWDLPVRLLHAGLATAVLLGWASGFGWWGLLYRHEALGLLALACMAARSAWGLRGRGPAAFRQFVRGPRAVARYARALWRRDAPRHLGHNPLGGWMILALLGWVAAMACTGLLLGTERYWGDSGMTALHQTLAWGGMGLLAGHLLGVAVMSWRHRECLPCAMVTGWKQRRPVAVDLHEVDVG